MFPPPMTTTELLFRAGAAGRGVVWGATWTGSGCVTFGAGVVISGRADRVATDGMTRGRLAVSSSANGSRPLRVSLRTGVVAGGLESTTGELFTGVSGDVGRPASRFAFHCSRPDRTSLRVTAGDGVDAGGGVGVELTSSFARADPGRSEPRREGSVAVSLLALVEAVNCGRCTASVRPSRSIRSARGLPPV